VYASGKIGIEGLLVFENTEDDVKEFAHDGATDSKRLEMPFLERVSPLGNGLGPTASGSGGHVKGFAQEAVTDFTETF
jgi:hypothetical protein